MPLPVPMPMAMAPVAPLAMSLAPGAPLQPPFVGAGAGAGPGRAPAGLSEDTTNKIRQVAKFCADKGVAKFNNLKENANSRTLMPFLFEGNPGYEEFMQTLKAMVYQGQQGGGGGL